MSRLILPLLFITFLSLTACHSSQEEKKVVKEVCVTDSLAKMISLDTVKMSAIDQILILNGHVSFDENKVVRIFPFTGGVITDIKASLGDKVKKEQTLASLKSADVTGLYSDLASAKADEEIAKREQEQMESLYKSGLSSQKDLTEAQQNHKKALAAVHKIEETIKINGGGRITEAGEYLIRSPIDGFVLERNVTTGQVFRDDNSESMFTISDLESVWVWADVFEGDISSIHLGDTAYITPLAYKDKTIKGKIDRINPILDKDNKVMKIRITLPNTDFLLKPEMFASVLIHKKEANQTALAIPSSAVIFDHNKHYVVIYRNTCDMEIRMIDILATGLDKTYIKSGLKEGECIISSNELLMFNALVLNNQNK